MPKLKDFNIPDASSQKVEEFMMTDLFTVRKDDTIQLVAEMID